MKSQISEDIGTYTNWGDTYYYFEYFGKIWGEKSLSIPKLYAKNHSVNVQTFFHLYLESSIKYFYFKGKYLKWYCYCVSRLIQLQAVRDIRLAKSQSLRRTWPVTRKWFSESVVNDVAQSPTMWMTEKAPRKPAAGWCDHTCINPESSATNRLPTFGSTSRAAKKIIARTATTRTTFSADSWWALEVGSLLHNDFVRCFEKSLFCILIGKSGIWFTSFADPPQIRRTCSTFRTIYSAYPSSLFSYICWIDWSLAINGVTFEFVVSIIVRDNATSPSTNIDHLVLSKWLTCFKPPQN